jgi:GNAT superfamily N-acetyltransferase
MRIAYRMLQPEDEGEAVNLWMRLLGSGESEVRQTFRDFQSNSERFAKTWVAIDDNKRLLATVCYWLRDVRGNDGETIRIGHLFHIATEPEAQRQGLASQLLAEVCASLENERCQYAILSARSDAVGVYARAGWHSVTRQYWRGTCGEYKWTQSGRYIVEPCDPRQLPTGWNALAQPYDRACRRQVGSLVRTSDYWTGYAAWMFGLYLDEYKSTLPTVRNASEPDNVMGYAVANFYDTGFAVSELVIVIGDPEASCDLMAGIVEEARKQNVPLQGQITAQPSVAVRVVLERFFGDTLHTVDDRDVYGYMPFMVKQICGSDTSIYEHDDVYFWPMDAY